MKIATFLTLACIAGLAACAPAPQPNAWGRVDADFTVAGGVWDDGSTVYVLAKTFEQEGQLAVCGTWTVQGETVNTSYFNDRVVESGILRLGGDTVVRGLGRFRRVKYAPDMTGKSASCFTTGRPWQAAYASLQPDIRLPRQLASRSFRIGAPSRNDIEFRQAPVPRIIR